MLTADIATETLPNIGHVLADLFWWSDIEINEDHPARPVVLAGFSARLGAFVAYQRIIKIDAKNERYLLQAKCGGGNWFAWADFNQVHRGH